MTEQAPTDDVLTRLREIWLEATPDTIAGDLAQARALVGAASDAERETAGRYLDAIRRLERWLHDL